MNLHPTDHVGMTDMASTAALRSISIEQLLCLGLQRLVYLRPALVEGERLFVIYGADGVPLAAADTVATAVEVAAERGLDFVAVH